MLQAVAAARMEADCKDWARRQLADLVGDARLKFSLVKRRAWSTVWKCDAAGRTYYLKAATPGFDVEPKLLERLFAWRPHSIVQPIAAASQRGWVLTADAGRPLRDADAADALAKLEGVLSAYAEMQVAATKSGAPALQGMLEDRSLAGLPAALERVIGEPGLLAAGGATAEDIERGAEWSDLCRRLCSRLVRWDMPMTLEHGDFHAGNLLVSGNAVRIADWGDACWSHPFFSLVVCVSNARELFALDAASLQLQRLKEAYVTVWRHAGFGSELEEACALVERLRPAHGVLQWSRGLASMSDEARASAARYMVGWLRTFA